MATLERLPDFPSFESCIKYYGKSILPPLLSQIQKNEINEIRHKAAAVQARIQKRNSAKLSLSQEVQVPNNFETSRYFSDEERQGSGDEYDLCKNLIQFDNTMPFSISVNSSSSLEEIREEEEEIILAIPSDKNPCDNLDGTLHTGESMKTQENVIFGNSLLDNVEVFHQNLQSVKDLNLFVHSDNEMCFSDMKYGFSAMTSDCQLNSEQLSVENVLGDQRLSEKGTEYHSLSTAIVSTYEELGCNLDSDSVITSVAQSSDLEKYLDCSTEDSHISDHSTIIDDGKDIDHCIGFSEATSSETIRDHSDASTPVVPLLLQSLTESQSEINVNNPFSISSPMDANESVPSNFLSQAENSNNNKLGSEQIFPIKKATKVDINQVKNDSVIEGKKNVSCSRHKRNSSYTIDIPSPVLLKSHADCPCLISPSSAVVPHCTSIDLKEDSYGSEGEKMQRTLTLQNHSENDFTHCTNGSVKEVTHPINDAKGEKKAEAGFSRDGVVCKDSSKQMLLNALIETVKKMHEKRVEKLLQEQHEQWVKLQLEFKEQELQLQQQIQSLTVLDCTDENSIQDSGSVQPLENSAQVKPERIPEGGLHESQTKVNQYSSSKEGVHSNMPLMTYHCEMPLPSVSNENNLVKSCITSDVKAPTSDAVHLASVLKALSDPAMQRKFEKVSAAVKGYLTRRLLKTVRLQSLLKTIRDTVVLLSSIYGRQERNFSKDYDLRQGLVRQLNAACSEVYTIFFELSTKERMEIISQSRRLEKQRDKMAISSFTKLPDTALPLSPKAKVVNDKSKLSSATLKRLERKKGKNHEVSFQREKTRSAASSQRKRVTPVKLFPSNERPKSSQLLSTSPVSPVKSSKVNGPSKKCVSRSLMMFEP